MSRTSKSISLHPGFKGFVVGVVNAEYKQRVYLVVLRKEDNSQIASATFEGQGKRVHMKSVFNNREHWSFGPFDYEATLVVTISSSQGGSFKQSAMVGPLSVDKEPESDYPMKFLLSTVISEDGADEDHDDCTVNVLQYK